MTVSEAIGLEAYCEKLFANLLPEPQISMALTGKLRIQADTNYLTFDIDSGEVSYVGYHGYKADLDELCEQVKGIVTESENNEKLRQLVWSYEHRTELIKT